MVYANIVVVFAKKNLIICVFKKKSSTFAGYLLGRLNRDGNGGVCLTCENNVKFAKKLLRRLGNG